MGSDQMREKLSAILQGEPRKGYQTFFPLVAPVELPRPVRVDEFYSAMERARAELDDARARAATARTDAEKQAAYDSVSTGALFLAEGTRLLQRAAMILAEQGCVDKSDERERAISFLLGHIMLRD